MRVKRWKYSWQAKMAVESLLHTSIWRLGTAGIVCIVCVCLLLHSFLILKIWSCCVFLVVVRDRNRSRASLRTLERTRWVKVPSSPSLTASYDKRSSLESPKGSRNSYRLICSRCRRRQMPLGGEGWSIAALGMLLVGCSKFNSSTVHKGM